MKKLFFILMILVPVISFGQTKNGYVKEKSGNQTYAGNYVNGKKEGCWVHYNEKDLLRDVTEYKNDKKNGVAVTLNNQGSLEMEEHYVDDVYHGEIRKYLRGNYLNEITTYNMGVKEGPYKRYYTDKPTVLMEEVNYVNGNKNGISKWYNNEGKLLAEYSYSNGRFQGKNILYYDNGKKMSEEEYNNDVPVGTYKEYFDDGVTLKLTGEYNNSGKRNGEWTEYNKGGQVVGKKKYVNGELK
ncbi:MAG: hypothetical protein LBP67_03345 [Bacteroidales bacterium]|jgi:antitoxin component YwqK of YwqJK toxin-antitoxin module|nr:hypothetical protein [Bacteroidales bacterium]